MKQKTIHYIAIGSAGNILVNKLKEIYNHQLEYSVVTKQDYGTIFPEMENYIPQSKKLNYYDKDKLPESFLNQYNDLSKKYSLNSGIGCVFSS